MNILHLSSEKTWRGGEQQIAYLVYELTKKGIHNFVACKKGSAFAKHCVENSIPHISLNFSGSFDVATANSIKHYCSQNNIDIVHMHSGNSHSIGVISSLLGNKSKLVLSRRVDFPIKNNWLSKFKFNYEKIEKIICVSSAIKAMILPSIKEYSKVTVVHSGLDLSRFSGMENKQKLHAEYNLKEDTKIVANISAIAPHKDYKTFVLTAKELLQNDNNFKFFIIGDGPSKNEIELFIEKNNLGEHIILTGFRNDVAEIFPEIDVFLITSITEGLGTTVLDAMANKIPVVATAAGGIPEMIKHEETGMLCKTQDYKELAKNIQLVLKDNSIKNSMVEKAYQLVRSTFTKENTASKTLEIYKSIL